MLAPPSLAHDWSTWKRGKALHKILNYRSFLSFLHSCGGNSILDDLVENHQILPLVQLHQTEIEYGMSLQCKILLQSMKFHLWYVIIEQLRVSRNISFENRNALKIYFLHCRHATEEREKHLKLKINVANALRADQCKKNSASWISIARNRQNRVKKIYATQKCSREFNGF